MAKKKLPLKRNESTGNAVKPVDHFIILGGKRRIITRSGRFIDLGKGIPADAFELYKSGFRHLGLKKGAEVLFQNESNDEIERLISQSTRKEDIAILKKALK